MDATVHRGRLVHHRDAAGKFDLVRRDLRHQRAGELADQGADHLVVAVRRNFLASCLELDRDFHPWALVDVVPDGFLVRQAHSAKLRLAASADREQVAPVVAVAMVVDRLELAHQFAERLRAARLADATALQVEVRESDAKLEERAFLKRRESPAPQAAQQAEVLVAQQPAAQVLPLQVQMEKVEPLALQPKRRVQLGLASEQRLEAQQQPAQQAQRVSERRPLVAVPPVLQQARSARALLVQQLDASAPPLPLLPLRLCPPWLSLRRPLLHPQRREGACEPSRQHRPESSWSASSFLLHRTRATGR